MSRIHGVDFTSAPGRRKPMTCAVCHVRETVLIVETVVEWTAFAPPPEPERLEGWIVS